MNKSQESIDDAECALHLKLLKGTAGGNRDNQATTPIFTAPLRDQINQYGLIAGQSDILANLNSKGKKDPRLFYNIAAPFSTFICGSQGSGKSHTLSCFLENCLAKSYVSKVKNPLSALLFHYDGFIGDQKGTPCEAAYLASNPDINVRVLCSPTNYQTISRTYSGIDVKVKSLCIDQTDLTTKRMFSLMAVKTKEEMPLYLHSITRVLRDLRMANQTTGNPFHYGEFKKHVEALRLTTAQEGPLVQRLDTLESFMPSDQRRTSSRPPKDIRSGTDWTIRAGELTIVDLSCPCVTAEAASSLFDLCLSLFLEVQSNIGKVVALDEAHKYMSASTEDALTKSLLSTIRLQRHLGTRIFISTQEPTINPALIDLCSMTIVHRFSSPEWLRVLRRHVAALDKSECNSEDDDNLIKGDVFSEIVRLRVGEALLFAPEAIINTSVDNCEGRRSLPENRCSECLTRAVVQDLMSEKSDDVVEEGGRIKISDKDDTKEEDKVMKIYNGNNVQAFHKLGTGYIKIKMRDRLTNDGGRSIIAA